MLNWTTANLKSTDLYEKYKGQGYDFSIGIARFEYLGVEQVWGKSFLPISGTVEKKKIFYGDTLSLLIITGSKHIIPGFVTYLEVGLNSSGSKQGGIFKVGYDLGLIYKYKNSLSLRPHVGAYLWQILDWDTKFDISETDAGYTMGLELNFLW